jgi:hypothetical protein
LLKYYTSKFQRDLVSATEATKETCIEKLQVTILDSCREKKDIKRTSGTVTSSVWANSTNEVVNSRRIHFGASVISFISGLNY